MRHPSGDISDSSIRQFAQMSLFTERQGGVEHCHLDAPMNATGFLEDWVTQRFGDPVA
jgi:hypothetical protein